MKFCQALSDSHVGGGGKQDGPASSCLCNSSGKQRMRFKQYLKLFVLRSGSEAELVCSVPIKPEHACGGVGASPQVAVRGHRGSIAVWHRSLYPGHMNHFFVPQ